MKDFSSTRREIRFLLPASATQNLSLVCWILYGSNRYLVTFLEVLHVNTLSILLIWTKNIRTIGRQLLPYLC